jgi:Xaa-Pro aminopeptidase
MAKKPASRRAPVSPELRVCTERLKRLRRAIAPLRCDALVITNWVDVGYLTPFSGEGSAAIVTRDQFWILSDARFLNELEPAKAIATVVFRKGTMAQAITGALAEIGAKAIAVQADHISVETMAGLQKSLRGRKVVGHSGILAGLRAVKGPEELAAIRKAIGIQQRALQTILPEIRPGQTEVEIAASLEFHMRRLGAEGTSFGTIVAAGANAAKPHARAGSAKVKAGQVLLIDFGARADGYCSDMTRTFAIGRWPKEIDRVYDVVLRAFHAGVKAVGPGVRCADVDAAARRVITEAGLGQYFGHGLGHGIGLDIHEDPRLSALSKGILRPGHVVTVEPGVYLPGIGGVRIEDDILVTADGRRNLCSLPKDKDWATL